MTGNPALRSLVITVETKMPLPKMGWSEEKGRGSASTASVEARD